MNGKEKARSATSPARTAYEKPSKMHTQEKTEQWALYAAGYGWMAFAIVGGFFLPNYQKTLIFWNVALIFLILEFYLYMRRIQRAIANELKDLRWELEAKHA